MSDYSVMDDIELLLFIQRDNENAYSEIYKRYWKQLFYTAYNIIQNKDEAQDAVQEVFIALWQRRNEAEIKSLKSYLSQATRFQVLKAIRSQKADEQFYKRLAEITADIVYENPLLFKEQENLLKQIMDALPEDCRNIFRLSREEHFTYKQIAGQLSISEKTVEKKMSICLQHIRQSLQQNLGISVSLLVTFYLYH